MPGGTGIPGPDLAGRGDKAAGGGMQEGLKEQGLRRCFSSEL